MGHRHEANAVDPVNESEAEIGLVQVVGFLARNSKKFAIGAVAGLVLSLGGGAIFGQYTVQMILDNSTTKSLDFTSWRVLETKLPLLAAQILEQKGHKSEDPQLELLSRPEWWTKNVVPSYTLSKGDSKNLAGISKELLDSGSTSIANLKVSTSNSSQETAEKNLRTTVKFIRTGSAYLALKAMLESYDASLQMSESDLKRKVTASEIELAFMNQRAKNLEVLGRRFPSHVNLTSNQVIDPKDSGAKYLPINTQLVAVNSDINAANEALARMRNQLAQQDVMRKFLERAKPVFASQVDGVVLVANLVAIEEKLRQEVDPIDKNQQQVVDNLRAELIALQSRFGKQLEESPIRVKKPDVLLSLILGIFGGVFVTLVVLLWNWAFANYRAQQNYSAIPNLSSVRLKATANL